MIAYNAVTKKSLTYPNGIITNILQPNRMIGLVQEDYVLADYVYRADGRIASIVESLDNGANKQRQLTYQYDDLTV